MFDTAINTILEPVKPTLSNADFMYGNTCKAIYGTSHVLHDLSLYQLSQNVDTFAGFYTLAAARIFKFIDYAVCRPPSGVEAEDEITAISSRVYQLVLGNPREAKVEIVQIVSALAHRFVTQVLNRKLQDRETSFGKQRDSHQGKIAENKRAAGQITVEEGQPILGKSVKHRKQIGRRREAQLNRKNALALEAEKAKLELDENSQGMALVQAGVGATKPILNYFFGAIVGLSELYKWYLQPSLLEKEYDEFILEACIQRVLELELPLDTVASNLDVTRLYTARKEVLSKKNLMRTPELEAKQKMVEILCQEIEKLAYVKFTDAKRESLLNNIQQRLSRLRDNIEDFKLSIQAMVGDLDQLNQDSYIVNRLWLRQGKEYERYCLAERKFSESKEEYQAIGKLLGAVARYDDENQVAREQINKFVEMLSAYRLKQFVARGDKSIYDVADRFSAVGDFVKSCKGFH